MKKLNICFAENKEINSLKLKWSESFLFFGEKAIKIRKILNNKWKYLNELTNEWEKESKKNCYLNNFLSQNKIFNKKIEIFKNYKRKIQMKILNYCQNF